MKYCPYCGSGLKENMMFCPKCGKAFEDATENPNMVDTDIDESIDAVEQDVICQEEQNIAEESAENTELEDKETIKVEPLKETRHKKRKLWPWFLTAFVICVAAIVLLYVLQSKENIADGNDAVLTTNNSMNAINSIKDAVNSVLYLELYDDKEELVGTASGFIIEDGNTLVTNYHVIEDAYSIVAWSADGEISYTVENLLAYDKTENLALLTCNTKGEILPLTIGDSDAIVQGDKVYAIGYPLGVANTLSDGIVSSRYIKDGVDYLQITAAISSGSSGGAVLNEFGEVVGVACAYYTEGQNLNLAIASADLKRLVDSEYDTRQLSDYYNPYYRYGATPINLLGGNIVAENEDYTFIVYDDNEIHRFSHNSVGKTDIFIRGTLVNLYNDSLYYYDSISNDIYVSDLSFNNCIPLNILSDEKIEATSIDDNLYLYEEKVEQLLVTNGHLFLNYSLYSNEELWERYLVVMKLDDWSTVVYCSSEICGNFTYYGDYIYVGLVGGGLLKLNMLDFSEKIIPTNHNVSIEAISDNGYLLYIDEGRNINSVFILDANCETISQIDVKTDSFSLRYNSNPSLVLYLFSYKNNFYACTYNVKSSKNGIYLLNEDGSSSLIKEFNGTFDLTYGVSNFVYKKCVLFAHANIKLNVIKGLTYREMLVEKIKEDKEKKERGEDVTWDF